VDELTSTPGGPAFKCYFSYVGLKVIFHEKNRWGYGNDATLVGISGIMVGIHGKIIKRLMFPQTSSPGRTELSCSPNFVF
jgi:hypothetical protein